MVQLFSIEAALFDNNICDWRGSSAEKLSNGDLSNHIGVYVTVFVVYLGRWIVDRTAVSLIHEFSVDPFGTRATVGVRIILLTLLLT